MNVVNHSTPPPYNVGIPQYIDYTCYISHFIVLDISNELLIQL